MIWVCTIAGTPALCAQYNYDAIYIYIITNLTLTLILTLKVIGNTCLDNASGPGLIVFTLDSQKMNAKSVLLKQTEVLEGH